MKITVGLQSLAKIIGESTNLKFVVLQNLKNQIMTTNVWVEQVRAIKLALFSDMSEQQYSYFACIRSGTTTSSSGTPRTTAEWKRCTCLRSTSGCLTSCSITSESIDTHSSFCFDWKYLMLI